MELETIKDAIGRIEKDNLEILKWMDDEYDHNFSDFFKIPEKLSKKLKQNTITDDELTEIMINLPLDLIDASTEVSKYKVCIECTKVDVKRLKLNLTAIKDKKSYEYMELNSKILNNDLVLNVNTALIERVEKQITLCKELIMSAKKIWDARRKSEQVMPINEIDIDKIPEYQG